MISHEKREGLPFPTVATILDLKEGLHSNEMSIDENLVDTWRSILENVFWGNETKMDALMDAIYKNYNGQLSDKRLNEIISLVGKGEVFEHLIEEEIEKTVSYDEYMILEEKFKILDSAMAEMMMIMPDLMMGYEEVSKYGNVHRN